MIDWRWVKNEVIKEDPKGSMGPAVDDCIKMAKSLVRPKSARITKKITAIKENYFNIEGPAVFSSTYLARHIKKSKEVSIFLVTIGKDLEEAASKAMASGEYLHGWILDRIGSLAVESLAEDTEKKLRASYKSKKKSVSARFSPGYCDWPIEEQYKLAKILDFSRAGVRLTDGCMMVPKKSISAIVAIGPEDAFGQKKSQCGICSQKECDYRRG